MWADLYNLSQIYNWLLVLLPQSVACSKRIMPLWLLSGSRLANIDRFVTHPQQNTPISTEEIQRCHNVWNFISTLPYFPLLSAHMQRTGFYEMSSLLGHCIFMTMGNSYCTLAKNWRCCRTVMFGLFYNFSF